MRIEKSFAVAAAPEEVWAFLTDPHRVAACLPGAAVTEQVDGRTYAGTIALKVGPVATSYKGKISFERLDPDAREVEIVGSGQDVRGKGGAEMRMKSRLGEHTPGETEVTVTSEIRLSGVLVQLGQRMIQGVADQLFQQFTEAMRSELEAAAGTSTPGKAPAASAAAEGIDVVALGTAAGKQALSRALRRPAFWVVAAALVTAVYFLAVR